MSKITLGLCVLCFTLGKIGSALFEDVSSRQHVNQRGTLQSDPLLKTRSKTEIIEVDKPIMNLNGTLNEFIDVIIRLNLPSLGMLSFKDDRSRTKHSLKMSAQQDETIKNLEKKYPDLKVTCRTRLILNAICVTIKSSILSEDTIATAGIRSTANGFEITPNDDDKNIRSITIAKTFKRDLSETVPYLGGGNTRSNKQHRLYQGKGIKIAILDSGVDYTHVNLGGVGTHNAYKKAYGVDQSDRRNKRRDGLFPTEKVVGGYDFIGEYWPYPKETLLSYLEPDNDPIDYDGHGTHVADIAAGRDGMAPEAEILAVKVCSSVGISCSEVALLQGMEYAVEKKSDIINLSLGVSYSLDYDIWTEVIKSSTNLGVLTVAAAGNCQNRPYCLNTPSGLPDAIAVAQTTLPSANLQSVNVNGTNYPALHILWSPDLKTSIDAPIQYGGGSPSSLNHWACYPYEQDSLTDKIILVKRGFCPFSLKVLNVERGGARAVLVADNIPNGQLFQPGHYSEFYDLPNITAYMLRYSDGVSLIEAIQATSTTTLLSRIDPTNVISLAGHTIRTTARGPSLLTPHLIKPDIAAPGESTSATCGSGDAVAPFGGTSGATPIISGAAAIVKEWCGKKCTPLAIKALLMNNAWGEVLVEDGTMMAEVTRVGSGEVRVERALEAEFVVYSDDGEQQQPSLGLGLVDGWNERIVIERYVTIINVYDKVLDISFEPRLRTSTDALTIDFFEMNNKKSVDHISLNQCDEVVIVVRFNINVTSLPSNFMNSGQEGINPQSLTGNEIDGRLLFQNINGDNRHHHPLSLPFHMIARKAAKVHVDRHVIDQRRKVDNIPIMNIGQGRAQIDSYDIVAIKDHPITSSSLLISQPPIKAIATRTKQVPDCTEFALDFAISTYTRQSHLVVTSYAIYLDINRDKRYDYRISTESLAIVDVSPVEKDTVDARQVVTVTNLTSLERVTRRYVEHGTNTANTAFRICGEYVGLERENVVGESRGNVTIGAMLIVGRESDDIMAKWWDRDALESDNIIHFNFSPFGEYYSLGENSQMDNFNIDPGQESILAIHDNYHDDERQPVMRPSITIKDTTTNDDNDKTMTKRYGLMIFTNGDRGRGQRGAATQDTECLLILAPGVPQPPPLFHTKTSLNDENDDDTNQEAVDMSSSSERSRLRRNKTNNKGKISTNGNRKKSVKNKDTGSDRQGIPCFEPDDDIDFSFSYSFSYSYFL